MQKCRNSVQHRRSSTRFVDVIRRRASPSLTKDGDMRRKRKINKNSLRIFQAGGIIQRRMDVAPVSAMRLLPPWARDRTKFPEGVVQSPIIVRS